jgi:hydrogenase/urease accessory protein HupE
MIRLAILFLAVLWLAGPGHAHELRPAYLELNEKSPGVFDGFWKVPASGNRRLALYARLPAFCEINGEPVRSFDGMAFVERWTAACSKPLRGHEISIDGLNATFTDVLLRIAFTDGTVEVARLVPDAPSYLVKGSQTGFEAAWSYFILGVQHILEGIDHLFFVLALLLLVHDWRGLVKAVTAFTVAHSITLTGATLGYFSLPQPPVEAVIALSIVFVAREIVRSQHGITSLSERVPWLMAFVFGLLHGFGFAGALQEVGLPQADVPLALLSFNLGVEAGQLLFVTAVLALGALLKRLHPMRPALVRLALAYAIGATAMAWFIERVVALV